MPVVAVNVGGILIRALRQLSPKFNQNFGSVPHSSGSPWQWGHGPIRRVARRHGRFATRLNGPGATVTVPVWREFLIHFHAANVNVSVDKARF